MELVQVKKIVLKQNDGTKEEYEEMLPYTELWFGTSETGIHINVVSIFPDVEYKDYYRSVILKDTKIKF